MTSLPFSPAADRNKQPILDALQRLLPPAGRLLELASGTGQHAAWIAPRLPGWNWQPSECNPLSLATIEGWTRESGVSNVAAPLLLDVLNPPWLDDPAPRLDAIYCANLLHVSPWSLCDALMRGARHHLRPDGGLLLVYGPFLETGVVTSTGNQAFHDSLQQQNPAWGLRQREAVEAVAMAHGLRLQERVQMPANNLLLLFAPV